MINEIPVVAIVQARHGCVRLPGKHTMNIGGQPLIRRAMDAAAACPLVDRVLVSSNDQAVLEVAGDAGFDTHRRSDELSSETTKMTPQQWRDGYLLEHRHWLTDHVGIRRGIMLRVMGNSILYRDGIIEDIVSRLVAVGRGRVHAAVRAAEDHPAYAVRLHDDGAIPWVRGVCWDRYIDGKDHETAWMITGAPVASFINPAEHEPLNIVEIGRYDVLHIHDAADLAHARAWWEWTQARSTVGSS